MPFSNGNNPPNKIPEEKVQEAYSFHQAHPNLTWEQLATSVGLKPSTIRHIFRRRWGIVKRNIKTRGRYVRRYGIIPQNVIDGVCTCIRTDPHTTPAKLAQQFGISISAVRSLVKKHYGKTCGELLAGIPTKEIHRGKDGDEFVTDNSFYTALVKHVAYVGLLEDENNRLKEQLKEKSASHARIADIMAKLDYELAHRD